MTKFDYAKWRKEHPHDPKKHRNYLLGKRYGITSVEYQQLWEKQGGRCLICKYKASGPKDLHVDHNHKNHIVRALLCPRCNSGLSFLEDKQWVKKATYYLEMLWLKTYEA